MAGRPKGAWSEKKFRDALNCAVTEQTKDGQRKLRVIAERLVEAAINGDIPAIKEVADRLDGKPAQAIIGGGEDDPPIAVITEVRRVIVDPKSNDT